MDGLVLTLHVRDSSDYGELHTLTPLSLIYIYVYLPESTSLKQLGELFVILLAGMCGVELFILLENFTPNRRG